MKHTDRECGYCTDEEDYDDIIRKFCGITMLSCGINLVYSTSMNF